MKVTTKPPTDRDLLAAVEDHLRDRPGDAAAWNAKGALLAKSGDFGDALRSLDTAIRLDPSLAAAHANRGHVLLALGPNKASDALVSFKKALELSPGAIDALRGAVLALRLLGRAREEIGYIDEILRQDGSDSLLWIRRGDLEAELGNPEAALVSYERVLSSDPDNSIAIVHKAVILARLGKFDEAIKSAERAVKISPDSIISWRTLADVYVQAEKYKAALKALERASVLDPTDPSIENMMGVVSYRAGDMKTAASHLERAVIMDHKNTSALRNLALVYMELERWADAAKTWSRFTSVVKDDAAAWDAQAHANARMNDFCSAAEAWEKARRIYKSTGSEEDAERVSVLGRAAKFNCSRQREADRARREHERLTRTFSSRYDRRRERRS
ncbi:MAG: tetratricopeptide repeat protein [Candidatus Thorarchaeota archaeon]